MTSTIMRTTSRKMRHRRDTFPHNAQYSRVRALRAFSRLSALRRTASRSIHPSSNQSLGAQAVICVKLQAVQTAARHHDADQQLRDAHAAEPVDNVASGHDLPVHEPFGADEPFAHSDDDGEVNLNPPEPLDNLFETWNEPPNIQGTDDFSTDEDEEIFQRLGQSNTPEDNVEDPVVPDDDPGAGPEDGDGVPGTQFDFSDVQEAVDIHADPLSCMDDHPAVHNAYIRAFISAAFYNATQAAVYHDLEGKERCVLRPKGTAIEPLPSNSAREEKGRTKL
ncbi:hypothetical protein DFJ58DRAFT_727542 [Suillus subalutaceus]|uniref:uncharacterized protein n=1 Tax=Suillus subalutaceus TaxID=48586 RepID=UPI001B86CCE4|nr:uncharacterized protein DFJ58DRAFT_727542 [Suillus subalutaceus]KAG1855340.1 hypothetical protein DFJ58DRAFT_727542 [Suillus subalutaceus]